MKLGLAVVLAIAFMTVGPVASAFANGDGVSVSGVVRNGTRGASPISVSGLEVSVGVIDRGRSQDPTTTTRTDGGGAFAVENLDLAPGRQFTVWVEYEGVVYRSDFASVSPGVRRLDLVIDIFETDASLGGVVASLAHMVVEFQRDHLFVTQLLVVDNQSDRTLVGTTLASGSIARRPTGPAGSSRGGPSASAETPTAVPVLRDILRLPLPRGVSEVRFQDDALSSISRIADGVVVIGRPLPPGRSQIIYSYLLPRQRDAAQFTVAYPYGAARATVLIPDVGLSATVDGLQKAGTLQTEDKRKRYLNFTSEQVAAGTTAAVQLSAIPSADIAAVALEAQSDTDSMLGIWLLLGLGVVALVLAVVNILRFRKPAGTRDMASQRH